MPQPNKPKSVPDEVFEEDSAAVGQNLAMLLMARRAHAPQQYDDATFEYIIYLRSRIGPDEMIDVMICSGTPDTFTDTEATDAFNDFDMEASEAVKVLFEKWTGEQQTEAERLLLERERREVD
jgi:hypothetical protein